MIVAVEMTAAGALGTTLATGTAIGTVMTLETATGAKAEADTTRRIAEILVGTATTLETEMETATGGTRTVADEMITTAARDMIVDRAMTAVLTMIGAPGETAGTETAAGLDARRVQAAVMIRDHAVREDIRGTLGTTTAAITGVHQEDMKIPTGVTAETIGIDTITETATPP